jgi:hypothetical protein
MGGECRGREGGMEGCGGVRREEYSRVVERRQDTTGGRPVNYSPLRCTWPDPAGYCAEVQGAR